jgi:hypothetical protein
MVVNPTSIREQIAENIEQTLADIADPQPVLVTREPFEVEKLAITQFPAVLIQLGTESRETVSMGPSGTGRRTGTIVYTIRGFVRGTSLDSRRNQLIDAIESALDQDRYRGLTLTLEGARVIDSQVTEIEVITRQPPLAEFTVTFAVRYVYVRGTA